MKKILFLIKGVLDRAVPIISISQSLKAGNNFVEIICGNISDGLTTELEKFGIIITSLNIKKPEHGSNYLNKASHWLKFRNSVKKLLPNKDFDFLYIATADTALALKGLFTNYKYILHLRELYDRSPIYMTLLKNIAQNAYKVVVPEENRSYLYYNFFKLKEVPIVIPNKPFYHPRKRKMNIDFLDIKIQNKIKEKKNILYQGGISKERDLTELIKSSLLFENYNLVLLGWDRGMLKSYLKINNKIIYIPFVTPPMHLNITSWADIGIITYDLNSLNTIYCAPNKIWEYAGFGIPVIGNINPGIKNIVEHNLTGVIVDFSNKDDIMKGINKINDKYDAFMKNSISFYEINNQNSSIISLIE